MISIVIPVYNSGDCLERCLLSIHNQTFSNFEAIIVNDGSTDNSAYIADCWSKSDHRFSVITQKNAGVSAARNAGIERSTGEAICFVDADDYVDTHYLEKLVAIFDNGYLSVCNFVHNEDDKKILLSDNWSERNVRFNQAFIRDYLVYSMGKTIAFSPWNKLFDNSLLHGRNIRFPDKITVGEDMIFVLSYLSACKKIVYVDEGLYHYCIRQDSAMNSGRDYLPAYEKTLHRLQNTKFGEIKIEDRTLNLWSREAITLILTNPFVRSMSYHDFKQYYNRLDDSNIFNRVKRAPLVRNIKRSVLSIVTKLDSSVLLYWLVRSNK